MVAIPYNVEGTGDFISVFAVQKDRRTGLPKLSAGHNVPVDPYVLPPYAPQCDPTQSLLDTLDGRLLHAVSALDPTTGAIEIWTAHAVTGGAGSEVRWYEITPKPLGNPTLAQSGAATDASLWAWNGAIAPDRTVNPLGAAHGEAMVLGFTTASDSACPAAQMVSKVGSDPQSAFVLVRQSPVGLLDFSCVPICRWGDYSGASPDPGTSLDAARGDVWLANEIPLTSPRGSAGTWVWQATP